MKRSAALGMALIVAFVAVRGRALWMFAEGQPVWLLLGSAAVLTTLAVAAWIEDRRLSRLRARPPRPLRQGSSARH